MNGFPGFSASMFFCVRKFVENYFNLMLIAHCSSSAHVCLKISIAIDGYASHNN